MPKLSRVALGRAGRQAVALLVLAACAAGITVWVRGGVPQKADSEQVEMTLAQALQEKPLWIDARARSDFEAEHIPGALPLNVADWEETLPSILEKWESGRTAVVYCDSPAQADSREVAERLRDFKLGPVWILQGGWHAWKSR